MVGEENNIEEFISMFFKHLGFRTIIRAQLFF